MQNRTPRQEFFEYYALAHDNARHSWEWAQSDMERAFAIDQSQIDEEWEDMLMHSIETKWMMILIEIHRIMVDRGQSRLI